MDNYSTPPVFSQEEPPSSPRGRRGCWFAAVAIVVVLALLGTTAYGAIYLLRQQMTRSSAAVAVNTPAATAEVATAVPETAVVPDPIPTATPNPNRINRIVIINSDGQVETMAPDSGDRRQLTDVSQSFQFPTWSPDGKAIAAIGASRASSAIFLLPDNADIDQENPAEIFRENNYNPFYLYWSPDGTQISFLASHLSRGMTLNVVPATEGAKRSELLQGSPIYWQWTANGQQLLLHADVAEDEARLTFVSPIDNEGTADDIASPGYFQAPGISSNGRYLAYAELSAGANSQLVIDDTTSGGRQEVRHAGQVAMSWSPAADVLAFTSGSPNSSNFWGPLQLFDAETGELRLLSPELVVGFFWSPDGRYIAAISAPGDNDEIVASASQGGQPVGTAAGKRTQQNHNFSLTLTVIEIASGQGRVLGEFEPTFLFLSQFLPFFDQYALSHRLWSPDSAALVLPVRESGGTQIYIYYADGSPRQFLTEGTAAFWSPQ